LWYRRPGVRIPSIAPFFSDKYADKPTLEYYYLIL
jgi:hypothetical protein